MVPCRRATSFSSWPLTAWTSAVTITSLRPGLMTLPVARDLMRDGIRCCTIMPGLFLCGPAVRHDNHVFCFIFKYRQRFAVVAKAIATSLGLPAEGLEMYRSWGMYLDDLSCCGEECVC